MSRRNTEEVFLDHLMRADRGDVEGDIEQNFAPDCVLMTSYGTFRGHDGVRDAARLLQDQLGASSWSYRTKAWHGDLAFLEWTADTSRARVRDGADSFLIRDGRIEVMTAHYTVEPKGE